MMTNKSKPITISLRAYHHSPFLRRARSCDGFAVDHGRACSTFAQFSGWRWHKGDRPPDDWKENRQAIEDDSPFRKALMTHLNDRLMAFSHNFSSDIVKWYKHEAIRRWKKVKASVDKGTLIKYWIHIANKPGSAGHLSGIRFVQQT